MKTMKTRSPAPSSARSVLVLITQNHFVEGLTMGGLKG